MGARVNFIFKQSDNNAVVLYSHWGEDSWAIDLAMALKHAAPRRGDDSYYIRNAISYFLQDSLMSETGFGISAYANPDDVAFMDHPILIDLLNQTISDETGTHSIDSFIEYHAADLSLSEQALV
jgi:hypothetical protein